MEPVTNTPDLDATTIASCLTCLFEAGTQNVAPRGTSAFVGALMR